MSVPTWERHLAKTEYIFQTYQLNCDIGKIIANLPKKYAGSYGDYLIKAGLQAVQYGLTANRIKIVDQPTFNTRRENLQLMRGCIDGMANAAYIYLEIARTDAAVPAKKKEKLYKWEEKLALIA